MHFPLMKIKKYIKLHLFSEFFVVILNTQFLNFQTIFIISETFTRLDFPDPPSITNYVRYDVPDFGDITEFSVSVWIREYKHQTYDNDKTMRYMLSYSTSDEDDNAITIGRDIENSLINICVADACLIEKPYSQIGV